eukprot:TRINITY_DN3188_c0_g1_i12.p1 TRINITY_DN3188_c0_g1~~TRINITY_DN3188_c0_g1_i12.p1  ORF type:complete len:1988 (+),score=986.46 TRINITY_DN3188_c0_g1_i12:162-6125(+)
MGGDEKEDEIPQRCLVYARLRPTKALDGIGKDGVYQLVHCNKKKIILGTPEEPIKTFNFDGSFTPANTQEEIFNEVAVASLDHVLKGFTSAIMCYGQTGTGKSYTMSHKSPGQEAIIPRSANYLFAKIKDMPTKEFHLSAHFVQIYRDTLSDLMVDPKEKQKVDIRFQDKTGVEIVNCTEVPVTSTEQFMAMYEEGDARRVVRPTKMNPDSSRGHTALVLYVKSKSVDPNDMSMPANGKITFIDLAGYERFEKTGLKDPVHIDEAKKINASLLALGYVVTALSNGDKHVPWRNSKLTRLLQDSIGGKSRSTIVITCGPASTNLHESQNSFDFGNRAMAVKVAAKLDVAVDYQKLSVKLQQQLDEQEEKLSKLEKAEKERDVERAATQDRHKRDMERLRTRHKDELVKLMEEGATNERVQKLIEMQDAETETLEDMQHDEQAVQEETFQEVVKEEMNERVQRERIRGSSMRKQISDDKRKELHAAYTLIAQLRAGSADLPDDETLKKIHDEVSGLAGSAKTPALAHLLVNTGAPPAGGLTIDAPMVQETGEDEGASQATSACPSPTTVNNAEIGILKQELVDMRQQLEETEQKGKEAIEKMKVAQKKAATKLKEERERNAQLLKTTASLEKMEALEGELDEVKTAKKEAERMLEEANERVEKLEKNLNGVTARVWRTTIETKKTQAKVEALSAERDELDEKYSILEQEKAELADEFNRKKRDIEIAAEEADAGASRVHGELKNELDAAKEKIAEHEAAIEEMTQKLGAVTKELEDLSTAKDEQEAGLRAEIEAAKGEASTSAKELEEGQAALAKRAEEVEADLAARQEELDDMVETTKDEVATVRAELMKQVEDMQSRTSLEVIGLKERIDELMGEMVQLKEDAENAKEQLAAAKDEAAAKEEELEEKNKALEEEVEAAKEGAAALRDEVAQLQVAGGDAAAAAAGKEEELCAEVEALKDEVDKLEGEVDEAAKKEAALQDTVEALTEEKEALTAEKEALGAAKAELEGKNADLAAANEELAAAKDDVAASFAASQDDLAKVEGELADVTAALEGLRPQLEEAQARATEQDEEIDKLDADLNEQVDKLLEGEKAMQVLAEEKEALVAEVANVKAAMATAEEESAKEAEDLRNVVEDRDAEVAMYKAKTAELEEALEEARAEAEDERELGKELAEEKEALQLELEEYKDQSEAALAEKERQEEELQNNVASLEDELATSGQYQEALEVRIKELEGALSELTGELNQEKSKAQVEAEAAKNKMMEERKMRDEEAERLKAEAERLKTDAAKDAEEMEKRMREEQAEAERRLKEEKEKVGGGKYKYTSKIVSQLERVGQFAIPRDAPSMARPEGLLVSLDPEEVKASLAYNLVVVGLQHSGKSSVQHCLVKGSHGLVRRAPDTTSPTTAFDLSRTVHKERSGGGGGFLGKKQASASANTHFTVWDTPCDPRHIAALPPGTLPVLGACYVVTFSLTDDFAGIAKRLEYVLQMVWANAKANMDEGMRLPVLLVGTRRDLLSSKDNVVVMKKIGEAKRWLKEAPMMRERFTLLDCFAVSCKEWSVQGDTGLKTGVSSFSQLMGFLSSDMANRYPITPPALLGEVENAGAQLDIHDWWTSLARSNPRDEADATLRAGHKAVLSLMLHLHRMRLRNVWLVGKMEFEAAVFDHIPSHVEKAQPFLKDQLKKICVQRGMAYTVLDKAMNDAREGVVLLKTDVLANFVASFLLPTVYLSNCTAFAEREKPGYLKGVLAKHAKLNIEEVWRPDWPLMFDGKVPQSTAPALMKAAPAFEKEVRLGCDFLPLLDLSFEVFSEDDNEKYQFMPAMALRHLSNTVVSMLLECFKKSNGGWIANTTKCDPLAYAETQAVLKGVHALNPGTARLWGDGAAVMVDGRWAFVRVEPAHVVICCEGKDSPLLAPLRQVVVAASAKANISDATWKDGMNLDHLPRLAPAYAKQVEDAASIEAFLAHLSADILRGTPYPQATVDKDIKRRGK